MRTHRFFCRQKRKPRRGLHAWVPPLFALLSFASDGAAWPVSLVPPFPRLALFPAYTHMYVVVLLLLSWAFISSSLRGVALHVRSIAGAVPFVSRPHARGYTHGATRCGAWVCLAVVHLRAQRARPSGLLGSPLLARCCVVSSSPWGQPPCRGLGGWHRATGVFSKSKNACCAVHFT